MGAYKPPFINSRDGAIAGLASILAVLSWTLPEGRWQGVADRLARLRIARRTPLSVDELDMIRIVVGNRSADWIKERFWPECLSHKYLSWMHILACHRPGSRPPRSRLIGKEHVDKALEGGRGVVLFTATFIHKDLMAKAAFAQAGYAISHLSMDTHGFSGTRFGKRWLNPIYTSAEKQFLRERMVFSGSNTKAVIARVRERLEQNAPVMITVTPLGRNVATRNFLHGHIHIATGGLNIACENGAPVLPVFTLRKADGAMVTFVGPALDRPDGVGRAEEINALISGYVPRLEKHVCIHPEQFSFPVSDRFGKALLSRKAAPLSRETRGFAA